MTNPARKRIVWIIGSIIVLIGAVFGAIQIYSCHQDQQLSVFSPFQKEYTGYGLETPLESGGAAVKILVNGEKNGLGEFRGSIRITRDGAPVLYYEKCTITCSDNGNYLLELDDGWTPDADQSKPNTIWGSFHADADWSWLVLQPFTELGREDLELIVFAAPATNREEAIAIYDAKNP